MSARADTFELMFRITQRTQVSLTFDDANTLRRAQITLHRWHEQECGHSNDYASWSIERDEETQIPYRCWYPHNGKMGKTRIADKEAGAIRRVRHICAYNKLDFYVQTDPRGCSLYVAAEQLTHQNYSSRGVACCS